MRSKIYYLMYFVIAMVDDTCSLVSTNKVRKLTAGRHELLVNTFFFLFVRLFFTIIPLFQFTIRAHLVAAFSCTPRTQTRVIGLRWLLLLIYARKNAPDLWMSFHKFCGLYEKLCLLSKIPDIIRQHHLIGLCLSVVFIWLFEFYSQFFCDS